MDFPQPSLPVVSADYADALLTARRARSTLILILLVTLLFQLGLFFAARYKVELDDTSAALDPLKYLVGLSVFLGVATPIVLAMTLWLIVMVMLLGRVVGVSHLVRAFVACVALGVLLFPWQAFLMNQTFHSDQFRIPGVLYSWSELVMRARAKPQEWQFQWLFWARFVAWPVVALGVLFRIHQHSNLGLRAGLRGAGKLDAIRNTGAAVPVGSAPVIRA